MKPTLKKTAVIGIGGTGARAVMYMKRKLMNAYGQIPPMIKFLVIDTTDQNELREAEVPLAAGEFMKIPVLEPAALIATNKEVREWLPDDVPRFNLVNGAKQVRPLGRLATFANAAPLSNRMLSLIGNVRDFGITRDENFEVLSNDIVVNIVCSLSGGTGSGAYFDIAVLVRKQLRSTDKLIGYFLMPDIFVGKPATDNVEPNTYAALKEISFLFESPHIRYTFGGQTRSVDEGLFNGVYVVNKTNKHGIEYNNIADLQEFLGTGMFLQSTATGKGASDIIDNLEAQIASKKWYGKPTVFSSFGISELVYPGDWYADLYTKKIAFNTLQVALVGGDVSKMEEHVGDYVRRRSLNEHEADDIINALGRPTEYAPFQVPKDLKKDVLQSVFTRRASHLADVHRRVHDSTSTKMAELRRDQVAALEQELAKILAKPQGVEVAKSFLATFTGILLGFKKELMDEREEHDAIKVGLAPRYEAARAEAEKVAKALLGTKSQLQDALKKYKAIVDREAMEIIEIERRDRAIDFIAHLLDETKQWLDRLTALSTMCSTLTQELSQEVQQMRQLRRAPRPFVQELKPANLTEEAPPVSAHEFLKWLGSTKGMDVMALSSKTIEEVKGVLLEYGASNKVVHEVRVRHIEDIFRSLKQNERDRLINELDEMAAPLWQYDQGAIAGDKHTENIYLFGVEDRDHTVFLPESLRQVISSPHEPAIVSTGDAKRIICFKVEASVPAFVLQNMTRYRDKYLNPDRAFPYHIDKEWEKLDDLFPGTGDEEAMKYWSLALAEPFNLIVRKGEVYYMRSERSGARLKDYLVKLAAGRNEAMKAFAADAERVVEAREAIERINEKLGNDAVIDQLRNYTATLEIKAKTQSRDIQKQVESELTELERYIEELRGL